MDRETLSEMARAYPAAIGPLKEVLHLHRGELKRIELTVGADGRNRYLLSAFSSKTGRNQPSNSKSIFGPRVWLRSLIRPGPGRAIAYVDWSAQELAIAAALSGDRAMQDAYRSGDPYLSSPRRLAPSPKRYQGDALDGEGSIQGRDARRALWIERGRHCPQAVRCPVPRSRVAANAPRDVPSFLAMERFRRDAGDAIGRLQTVFGWTVHVGPDANPRSLRNFPMQGNGAEMLRLACCLATERVSTFALRSMTPYLWRSAANIEAIVTQTQQAMKEAGANRA